MVLSDLLRSEVIDGSGRRIGHVRDIAVEVSRVRGRVELKVTALLVGPGAVAERLGYAYGPVRGPWLLRVLLGRRARRMKRAPWSAIAEIGDRRVLLSVDTDDLGAPGRTEGA